MTNRINRFFGINEAGSQIHTEALAGVSTFLALSYIFIVNPAILSAAGVNKSGVYFATIVGSVLTTLAMGLWANKPFAVAPGLEMNAYVAYVVVGTLGFTWQGAMGGVFWSGVLTLALSLTKLRTSITEAIPSNLKTGLATAVGVLLMLIALKVSGVIHYEGVKIAGVGKLNSPEAGIFLAGLLLIILFRYFKIRGSVLLSILGSAVIAHFLGIGQYIEPITISKEMLSTTFALNLGVITNPRIWSVVVILFILDFYGSIAKFIGLTQNTSIVDKNGNLPQLKEAMIVDGAGTVLGAGLGTSNLITYVESAVGIGEGGRTGLTAVVCAILMSLFFLITPIVSLIPIAATTGPLFIIGLSLIPFGTLLHKSDWIERTTLLSIITVTIWSFSLDKAMFAGFTAFIVLSLFAKKYTNLNRYLVGSAIVLLLSITLSH